MTTNATHSEERLEKIKKGVLISVFITILIDLIGFGMFIPLVPILARDFGGSDSDAALLSTYYSIANMIAVVILGYISDKIGRKKILIISIVIACLAQIGAGFAQSYFWLLIARLVAGFSCGNLPAAQSAIADITTPEERTKYMVIIGLAFGAGFALGPIIASGILLVCHHVDFLKDHHFLAIAISSAFLNILNLVYLAYRMPETHHKLARGEIKLLVERALQGQKKAKDMQKSFSAKLQGMLKTPGFFIILVITFLHVFALIGIETMMPLFLKDAFSLRDVFVYSSYIFLGICMFLTNSYLSKIFFKFLGDVKTLYIGLFLTFLGIFVIPMVVPHIPLLFICFFLFAAGEAACNPALMGILSKITTVENQGFAFGLSQSVASLARIIGPAFMGLAYENGMGFSSLTKVNSLYLSGVIMIAGLLLSIVSLRKFEKKFKAKGA